MHGSRNVENIEMSEELQHMDMLLRRITNNIITGLANESTDRWLAEYGVNAYTLEQMLSALARDLTYAASLLAEDNLDELAWFAGVTLTEIQK